MTKMSRNVSKWNCIIVSSSIKATIHINVHDCDTLTRNQPHSSPARTTYLNIRQNDTQSNAWLSIHRSETRMLASQMNIISTKQGHVDKHLQLSSLNRVQKFC